MKNNREKTCGHGNRQKRREMSRTLEYANNTDCNTADSISFSCNSSVKKLLTPALLFYISLLFSPANCFQNRLLRSRDDCYDDKRNPIFCQPQFENIALKKRVLVTETCGVPRSEFYCRLENNNRLVTRICDRCDRTGPRAHPARHLTDINDNGNVTYWQSKPIESKRNVTLKISFDKKYELSYISVQFFSPRPASMVVYKSVNNGRRWTEYQFYARNCLLRFGRLNHALVNHTNDHEPLCLEDSSDPLPLSGGRIIFNPRKDRPSESNFENSHVLQEWVTATDIKIVLQGVNDIEGVLPPLSSGFRKRGAESRASEGLRTFRGAAEMRKAKNGFFTYRKGSRRSAPSKITNPPASVSQYAFGSSHFYAINDLTIGGRCKCNGHASRCIMKKGRLVCDCKHNTDGPNCERCKAFHHDREWKRGTKTNANACVGELHSLLFCTCFSLPL